MRPGTPGFQGNRLTEARQIRGLTGTFLAEIVDLTSQSISKYETGRSTPSPEVLARLSDVLAVPESFFLAPVGSQPEGRIFYRSMSSATKSARLRAERRFGWLHAITDYVAQYVELPEVNLPSFDVRWERLSGDDIDEIAAAARAHWGMPRGPVANVISVLENHGVVVARDELGAHTLDSLSVMGSRPSVLIGTDKGSAARWRFDACHELGHLLLHQAVTEKMLATSVQHKQLEQQAHRFAAAFLLPSDEFSEDVFAVNLDALRSMKMKWRVSVGMMIRRLLDTELIDEQQYRQLMMNYGRRGWRRNEPLDDSMPHEEPMLLRKALDLIVSGGIRTPEEVAGELHLPARDIETLSGLEIGSFINQPAMALKSSNVVSLTDWRA